MAKARPLARKAMELGPELGDPWTTMGLIRAYADWDWEGAEADLRRALELDPGSAWAHNQYGQLLAEGGRFEEALEQFAKASELEPVLFDPGGTDAGRVYEWMGRFDEAIAHWQRQIEITPGHYTPYMRLGDHYCRHGDYERALPLLERAAELNRLDPWVVAIRGYCHALHGRIEEAAAIRTELERRDAERYVTPMAFALIEIGLGDHDRAFEFLERAYALRALRMLALEVDPCFEPIRRDPRYEALLRRMGPGMPAGSRAIERQRRSS